MHAHEEHCNCGHHHDHVEGCDCHTHGESCGCHTHGEGCSCGHSHVPIPVPEHLTPLQTEFLVELHQRHYLPIACFSMTSSSAPERMALALEPVFISAPEDTMEQVKLVGGALSTLCDMDLISLDYDCPLEGYDYTEYSTSALYAYFVETVAEAARRPDSAFDTPMLELGSMALTEAGLALIQSLLKCL